MKDCIFCKIVKGQLPSKKVYEGRHVLAFVPKEEASKGHTMLITKSHFENVLDVDEGTFIQLAKEIRKLSLKLVKDNNATGINILNASGKDAQQSVFHLHFHLVPRYPDDGLDMWIKQRL